jgi:hypothetical protein
MRKSSIPDPGVVVATTLASLQDLPVLDARLIDRVAYRLFHICRGWIPLNVALWSYCCVARGRGNGEALTLSAIGKAVRDIEIATGLSNCYPRALLTSGLCFSHGYTSDLLIGCLAPTTKMHAWTVSDGVVPYEPQPEHYLYRPLIQYTIHPVFAHNRCP